MDQAEIDQHQVCEKWAAGFVPSPPHIKLGVSQNVRDGLWPLNGLRHPATTGTTGWYLWAGEEMSDADDFFVPLHVEHLAEWRPEAVKYLGLAPGWRFLIAPGQADVWFDPSLLEV